MCIDCRNWRALSRNQIQRGRGRRDDDGGRRIRAERGARPTTHHVLPLLRHTNTPNAFLSSYPTGINPAGTVRFLPLHTGDPPHRKEQIVACPSERRPIHAASRHGLQDKLTLTDGARVARRRRDAHVIMVAGACYCESLWLGGCMGGRRNVEETNKEEALVGFCLCPCADCEPDHGLPSLWAAFRRTGSWPGRSCRGWAVLCGW